MDGALAHAGRLQARDSRSDARGHIEAVEEIGMGEAAIIDIGDVADVERCRIGIRWE